MFGIVFMDKMGRSEQKQREKYIQIRLEINRNQLKAILIVALGLIAAELTSETLTMTTWYPSPSGTYKTLRATMNAYFAYSGGSVGIGTTAPANKLSVSGNADFSGSVGIGTTSPNAIVEVVPNGAKNVIRIIGETTGNLAPLVINETGTTAGITHYGIWSNVDGVHATGDNIAGYFTATGGANNYGLLIPNGNVGIGTTSPGAKLNVAGNIIRKSGTSANAMIDCVGGITYTAANFTCLNVQGHNAIGSANNWFIESTNVNLQAVCYALGASGTYPPASDNEVSNTLCRANYYDTPTDNTTPAKWVYSCSGTSYVRSQDITCRYE